MTVAPRLVRVLPPRVLPARRVRQRHAVLAPIFRTQNNLALTYQDLGRVHEALSLRQEVYSGTSKLYGEEHDATLRVAANYANSLTYLRRFEEAKALLRKMMPVARRVLGDAHFLTLNMRANYARTLNNDPNATLDDLNEAVTTLQDAGRTARRVMGGANPTTVDIEGTLQTARAHLRARERQSASGSS